MGPNTFTYLNSVWGVRSLILQTPRLVGFDWTGGVGGGSGLF